MIFHDLTLLSSLFIRHIHITSWRYLMPQKNTNIGKDILCFPDNPLDIFGHHGMKEIAKRYP